MKLEVRREHGVAVVELEGRLSHSEDESTVHAAVSSALDEGASRVVIDLSRVTAVDSSGLGELIRCSATCHRRGAELRLAGVNGRLRQVMAMCRLGEVLSIEPGTPEPVVEPPGRAARR